MIDTHVKRRLKATVCLFSVLTLAACGGGGSASDLGATASALGTEDSGAAAQSGEQAVAKVLAKVVAPTTKVSTSTTSTTSTTPASTTPATTTSVATTATTSTTATATPAAPAAVSATPSTSATAAVPATTAAATTTTATTTAVKGANQTITSVQAVRSPVADTPNTLTVQSATPASSTAAEVAAANTAAFPFVQPSLATLRKSAKKVFAHYLTPFPISLDNMDPAADYYALQYLSASGEGYKFAGSGGFLRQRPLARQVSTASNWDVQDRMQDVRRAAALGIDGFAVDLLASTGLNWSRAQGMLDAAFAADPGFKILLMPDMEAEFKSQPQNVLTAIRALAKHPSAYRLEDGRLVVSPYNAQNQTPAWWKQVLDTLRAEGTAVAFFPVFQGWYRYANDYASISYGMSDWGVRSPNANRSWSVVPGQAHAYGPKWMMPVSPQDYRAKDLLYWEAGNSENYRVMWENAINGGSDWVQIVTWNDYSEGTEIAPSSGTQWSFYDLTAYYTAWFKTGVKPTVARDVLYYFHRKHATTAQPDATLQRQATVRDGGSDAATDEVELLAFAATAGTLQVTLGSRTYTRDVTPGMTSFKVPLAEGTPMFKLIRGNATSVALRSEFPISNTIVYQDFLYRSGSSSRALVAPR